MTISFNDAVRALDQRTNLEASGRLTAPTLDRMRALIDVIGQPHEVHAVIAVTGTNGKSTAAMACSALLAATGLRVGTYLSPHVTSLRERVRYDLDPITETDFAVAWEELAPILDFADERFGRITWFEAMTALAFLVFADRGVDIAVLEVGMGGAWDATNVADAAVALALEVGSDHPVLGDTPVAKAGEKAGIIKPDAVLVLAAQPEPGVTDVFKARAKELEVPVFEEPLAWEMERAALALAGQSLTFRLGGRRYSDVFLPMFGERNARSAVAGFAAAHAFLGQNPIDDDVITAAMRRVVLPARMEILQREPLVVIDGAHNPEAARALAEAMPASFRYDDLHLILGAMSDKDLDGIAAALAPVGSSITCVQVDWPRAVNPHELAAIVRRHTDAPVTVGDDPREALDAVIAAAKPTDAVLVAGSLYLAGAVRPRPR